MKNKKESIVVFEDWFRYARCLNDAEFREFMSAILNYYKTQEQPKFTGLMFDVWNDIIDDLSNNVSKKQEQRERGNKMKENNPKLNPALRTMLDTMPGTGPDTELSIVPNIALGTSGMGDGRCETGDDDMIDDDMIDDDMVDINKNVRFHNTSSIPGVYKPSIETFDEMFSDI